MAKLTSQQANDLADYFSDMAQVIEDYRNQNFGTLSESQNQEIKDLLNYL